MRSTSLTYMPALDGLRAVAVALVFVIHAFPDSGFAGGLGVDIFFVISGYLITSILLRQWDRSGRIALGTFYFSRLVRLYPPLIIVAVASLLAFPLFGQSFFGAIASFGVAVTYTSNLVMTWTGSGLGGLSHTWSLAMEEQFYLLWPLGLGLMLRAGWSRTGMAAATGAIALASFVGWVMTGDDFPVHPLTKAGGLLVGCLLALAPISRDGAWSRGFAAWSGVAIFIAAMALETAGVMTRAWALPIATAGIVPVILHAAYGEGAIVRFLSFRPIVFLGLISYGLYLWHYPLLQALFVMWPGQQSLSAVIAGTATIALASATYYLVERPSLAWRAQVVRRWAASRTDR